MLKRISLGAFALAGLALAILTGCSATGVDSIQISPTSQSLAVGQTVQFTATGVVGHGQHPSSTEDVTTMVTWTSSAPAIATVNSSGMATAASAGTTTITASMNGFPGLITATATVTVTGTGSTGGGSPVVASLAIIPGTQSVAAPGETSQFLAIGTTSSGSTLDLTNQVAWSSSSAQIATIGANTGLATAVGQGTVTIAAIFSNVSAGTAVSGTATFIVTNGSSEPITSVAIVPGAESVPSGQNAQLFALGTSGTGATQDITSAAQLTWTSSIPSIATVSSTGLVTGVTPGSSAITAEWKNPDGTVVSQTIGLTVTAGQSTLLSLAIIPSGISVNQLQMTGNFIAVGTFSTPPIIRDLTNSVMWLSSAPNYFPVSTNSSSSNPGAPGGIVTAYAAGGATIIAEATDPVTGSIQTATGTFSCPYAAANPSATPPVQGSCDAAVTVAGPLLTTITVYNEGNNTTNWLVTAPSATGTPNVLHCGPGWTADGNTGGSVCVATYPLYTNGVPTKVTLTAPSQAGVKFGGWSSNCTPSPNPPTESGTNTCTMILTNDNVTVGAIFN